MNIIFALVAALAIVGCKPNDTHVKTVKERVDAGEVVWFSEPGTKLPNCRVGPDWPGIRNTPKEEVERIVLGKQRTVAAPGNRNCYRIGSKIMVIDGKPSAGIVVVQALGIARLDLLRQGDLKGRYFDARSEFDGFTNKLASRMGGNKNGYIYLVNVAYVGGTAVNEKAIKDADKLDGYEETTKDGDSLGCNAWTTMEVAMDFLNPILDGKLKSYYKLGSSNCIAQGATIELKERLGTTYPVLAKVKVKKVKRFKVSALAARYFELDGFDFNILKNHVTAANLRAKEERMTVVDFELVPAHPVPVTVTQNCPPAINLSRPLTEQIRVNEDAARCAHEGSLTQVVTVNGNESLAIPVRVKSRMNDSQSSTVVLELERLDDGQGEQP
jgi:hypothetical protein